MPLGRLNRCLTAKGVVVRTVDGDIVRVYIGDDVRPGEGRHRVQGAPALFPHWQLDALRRLVHAAARDEDVLLTLLQGTLERLNLADKIEVGTVHLLNVTILCHKLIPCADAVGKLPHCSLAVLLLYQLGALKRFREKVQRVNGHQVHANEHLWEVLPHERHKDVVCGQPCSGKDDPLPVLWQVLLHVFPESVHLLLKHC
mmetsp:Transcript_8561/g.20124  ORF Transcript_8561/g.20124 Transcript_8561/m.20124 type:complete len:200 (+) Transcript_8561:162-761(+)